jgi:hypothetical protein
LIPQEGINFSAQQKNRVAHISLGRSGAHLDPPAACRRCRPRASQTISCVAAAHWLQAAAEVVAEHLGVPPAAVIREAGTIEFTPQETPITVLDLMDSRLSPHQTVTSPVRNAMLIAEGLLPDVDTAARAIKEARRRAKTHVGDEWARLTPLGQRRPSRDLLEDLLAGIRGCWLVYPQCVDYDALGDVDHNEIDDMFLAAVRARATERRRAG